MLIKKTIATIATKTGTPHRQEVINVFPCPLPLFPLPTGISFSSFFDASIIFSFLNGPHFLSLNNLQKGLNQDVHQRFPILLR